MNGLAGFGYTSREGEFLRITSLVGGYFLRRHFNEFVNRRCGAIGQQFIRRALKLAHIAPVTALGGRVFYHVQGSAVYAAVGDPENRNRRDHRPDHIRRRLMALDLVLSDRSTIWLLAEKDKVAKLAKLGISQSELPCDAKAKRLFIDQQPVGVREADALDFYFVDDGSRTLAAWRSFLKRHRAILNRLPAAEVVFATWRPARADSAKAIFRHEVTGEHSAGGIDLERLRRYFNARRAFDAGEYHSFDKQKLDDLRECRRVFSGEQYEQLFRVWCQTGDAALPRRSAPSTGFRLRELPFAYEWLSPLQI